MINTFAPMPYYIAVYFRNEILTVKEIAESAKARVERHPNGRLIYAIIYADDFVEASEKAKELTDKREGEESD
jgi:hypothetical protein